MGNMQQLLPLMNSSEQITSLCGIVKFAMDALGPLRDFNKTHNDCVFSGLFYPIITKEM